MLNNEKINKVNGFTYLAVLLVNMLDTLKMIIQNSYRPVRFLTIEKSLKD